MSLKTLLILFLSLTLLSCIKMGENRNVKTPTQSDIDFLERFLSRELPHSCKVNRFYFHGNAMDRTVVIELEIENDSSWLAATDWEYGEFKAKSHEPQWVRSLAGTMYFSEISNENGLYIHLYKSNKYDINPRIILAGEN